MELAGGLYLWRMAKLGEFNERRVRNGSGCGASEIWIVAERLRDLSAGAIAALGCTILATDDQHCRHGDIAKLVDHRLGEDHVRGLSLVPRYHLLALVREPRV